MRERIEVNSEEKVEKHTEETVEQKVEQSSEEVKETISQSSESTEEQNTTSESTEQQPNTQARNTNSFFGRRLYLPCPEGATDHLHIIGLGDDGLVMGIVHGDERVLAMLALRTMMEVLSAANEEENEEESEEESEEENSKSCSM